MDFYTKSEIDEKFGVTISSPSWRDLYTKTEIETNVGTPETLVLPADMLDFYTKTEIDSIPIQPAITWPEYKALYAYSAGGAAHQLLWETDAIYYQYYAALMAIMDGLYTNGAAAITPGNYSGVTGYYLRNGVQKFGSVYYRPRQTYYSGGQSDTIAVFLGDDCGVIMSCVPTSGNVGIQYYVDFLPSSGVPCWYIGSGAARRNFTVSCVGTGYFEDIDHTFSGGYFYSAYFGSVGSSAPVEMGSLSEVIEFGGFASKQLLGQTRALTALPTSEDFPTITAANAFDYIENVLNPWAVQNSAELETYLFHPTT